MLLLLLWFVLLLLLLEMKLSNNVPDVKHPNIKPNAIIGIFEVEDDEEAPPRPPLLLRLSVRLCCCCDTIVCYYSSRRVVSGRGRIINFKAKLYIKVTVQQQ